MAEKSVTESPTYAGALRTPHGSQATQDFQQDLEVKTDRNGESYLEINCGEAHGWLYLEMLGRVKGAKTLEKCILHEGNVISPQEFEQRGGKRAKAWRKSIKHKGKQLATLISKGAITEHEFETPLSLNGGLPREDDAEEEFPSEQSLQLSQPTMEPFLVQLEGRLTALVESAVQKALNSMRSMVQAEMEIMRTKLAGLEERILNLEVSQRPNLSAEPILTSNHSQLEKANTEALEIKLNLVSKVLEDQQKLIEMKERAERANNVVIFGLAESNTHSVSEEVSDLFNTKLGQPDVHIASARRLGKLEQNRGKPRPVLVSLVSSFDKATVMKNKKNLAGTKIFINNDLTKEQAREDKRLRDIKKRMMQDESYHGKKISIYKGKIYVNRQPADQTSLQAFDQAC